jgi:hypothetical protein
LTNLKVRERNGDSYGLHSMTREWIICDKKKSSGRLRSVTNTDVDERTLMERDVTSYE